MTLVFEETARRQHVWLRAFFMGPTGSGKSRGALELATRFADAAGVKVTLINTEIGREYLYADRFAYSLINLAGGDQSPETFVKALDLSEKQNPGGVIVVDSVTHEWAGKNGVLQQADRFGDWKTVRPKHQDFVERLLQVQGHVIVTCRAKMKYEVGEVEVPGRERPRQVVTQLGVGPIQDGDLQYEFNCVARFEQATHEAMFSGHVDSLQGHVTEMIPPGVDDVFERLSVWLSEGEPPAPPEAATDEQVEELRASLLAEEKWTAEEIEEKFANHRRTNRGQMHPEYVAENLRLSKQRLARKAAAASKDGGAEAKERETATA